MQVLSVSLNWLQSSLEENPETFSMWKCFPWFHTASWVMENCADNRWLASKENALQNRYSALNSVLFECRVVALGTLEFPNGPSLFHTTNRARRQIYVPPQAKPLPFQGSNSFQQLKVYWNILFMCNSPKTPTWIWIILIHIDPKVSKLRVKSYCCGPGSEVFSTGITLLLEVPGQGGDWAWIDGGKVSWILTTSIS